MFLKEKPKNIGLRWLLIMVWDTICMFGVVVLTFSRFSSLNEWLIIFIMLWVIAFSILIALKYNSMVLKTSNQC